MKGWKYLDEEGIEIISNENIKLYGSESHQVIELLDEYYYLLPNSYKKEEIVPFNDKPHVISNNEMFREPTKRIFLSKYGSRLEFLKGFYMEICSLANENTVRKFCQQIDYHIDFQNTLKKLELNHCLINDKSFNNIVQAIINAIDYEYV